MPESIQTNQANSKSLGIYQFKTIGASYKAANSLSRYASITAIELSQVGAQGQLLCTGTHEELVKLQKGISVGDLKLSLVLPKVSEELVSVWLGQKVNPARKNLFFIQSSSLPDILRWSQEFLNAGYSLIELRQQKTKDGICYLILSKDSTESWDSDRLRIIDRPADVDQIEGLDPKMSRYFDLLAD